MAMGTAALESPARGQAVTHRFDEIRGGQIHKGARAKVDEIIHAVFIQQIPTLQRQFQRVTTELQSIPGQARIE